MKTCRKGYHAFIAEEARAKKKDYLQYRIGKLFSFGYGVEQDYTKATEWYEKAMAEDNPFAAYALGSLYRRGQGVEQDDEKAYTLYCVAAEHEKKPNAYAAYELGRMCGDGVGTKKNQTASCAWYRQAYQGYFRFRRQSQKSGYLYARTDFYHLRDMSLRDSQWMTNTRRFSSFRISSLKHAHICP